MVPKGASRMAVSYTHLDVYKRQILLNYHTDRAVLDWLADRVAALEEEEASGMYEADLDIEQ